MVHSIVTAYVINHQTTDYRQTTKSGTVPSSDLDKNVVATAKIKQMAKKYEYVRLLGLYQMGDLDYSAKYE